MTRLQLHSIILGRAYFVKSESMSTFRKYYNVCFYSSLYMTSFNDSLSYDIYRQGWGVTYKYSLLGKLIMFTAASCSSDSRVHSLNVKKLCVSTGTINLQVFGKQSNHMQLWNGEAAPVCQRSGFHCRRSLSKQRRRCQLTQPNRRRWILLPWVLAVPQINWENLDESVTMLVD